MNFESFNYKVIIIIYLIIIKQLYIIYISFINIKIIAKD